MTYTRNLTVSSGGENLYLYDFVDWQIGINSHIFFTFTGKILHTELCGPINRGLSHNPERYAARGVRPVTPYPGLFVGGSDLTIGESFAGSIVGGWLAANAVVGYGSFD